MKKNKIKVKSVNELLDVCIKWGSLIITIVIGYFTLYSMIDNFFMSILYNVDFSMYKVDLDLYKILMIFLIVLACYFYLHSLKNICLYINSLRNKIGKGNIFPIVDSMYFLIITLTLTMLFWKKIILGIIMLLIILSFGIIGDLFMTIVIGASSNKLSMKKESLLMELHQLVLVFITTSIFGVSVNFYNISNRDTYYYLKISENDYEVIIQNYSDYYITKKAEFKNDNLIICKDSQIIRSVQDQVVLKKTFSNIYMK